MITYRIGLHSVLLPLLIHGLILIRVVVIIPCQLTYSIHFELAAVHQHWDDRTRKTNNSLEKHRKHMIARCKAMV